MRKLGLVGLCLLLLLGIMGCDNKANRETQLSPTPENAEPIYPQADAAHSDEREFSLYFRFQGEKWLARETRRITLPYDQQLERILIEALIEGPRSSILELTPMFVPGTKLVSVYEQEGLYFVTLSHEFLDTPPDIPYYWRQDGSLTEEVLLRRRLAVDAIVNTLSEATACSAIQLLIQGNPEELRGDRIARSEIYRSETDKSILFGPITRSESMILTHYNTANMIMQCWQEKDWERLYRFVSLYGAENDEMRPTADAFEQEMERYQRSLLSYSLSPGLVSANGQNAVLSVQMALNSPEEINRMVTGEPVQLKLENGIWKIALDALIRLMNAE